MSEQKTSIFTLQPPLNIWNRYKKMRLMLMKKGAFYRHLVSIAKCNGQISVLNLLNTQNAKEQEGHRKNIIKKIGTLIFLANQALSIRGHEKSEGNLRQLQTTRLHKHESVKQSQYISSDIVNEMLRIISHNILRSLMSYIRRAKWFSIMADERRDIANREQLVLCIRWVSENNEVFEDPVGLYINFGLTVYLNYQINF